MEYDVIVVGAGASGLTSAAYLCKEGYKVLLCEKGKNLGGLVNSFDFNGFRFDGGIRAIENSGIVMPMLKQLGIEVDFLENNVSIGIKNNVIKIKAKEDLEEYKKLLSKEFPNNILDIENIINEIKNIMKYMDILYGVDNPLFLDLKEDKEYFAKTITPWLFKYAININKIVKLNKPVDEYLRKFTENQALIDLIIQHFFEKTPTFFALSYFSLYMDYKYPKGGTGAFIEAIEKFIIKNKCEIKKNTEICSINLKLKKIKDSNGNEYTYKKLIWASDLRKLYNSIDLESIENKSTKEKIIKKKNNIINKKGGDSVLTLYLTTDLDKSYFENICTEHLFYTPVSTGLSTLNLDDALAKDFDKEKIINLIKKYYSLTTYEISIPVMRDESMAPKGKTGLIISTLMDYSLVKSIYEMGWYEEFKKISEQFIIEILDKSIFEGIKSKIIDQFISTPLTLERFTGNYNGAISGWSFANTEMPVENKLTKIAKAINTEISDVFKVGQWSFSPSGLPTAILTGKLATDKIKN